MPLHDDERIGLEILAGNKPGFAVTVAATADTEALALPERVKSEAHVPANGASVRRLDRAGFGRQVAV